MVDVLGFEPRLAASEADVLPLYDTSMVLSTRIELVFWLYQSHVLNLYTMRGLEDVTGVAPAPTILEIVMLLLQNKHPKGW